jgi:hypothetical protein
VDLIFPIGGALVSHAGPQPFSLARVLCRSGQQHPFRALQRVHRIRRESANAHRPVAAAANAPPHDEAPAARPAPAEAGDMSIGSTVLITVGSASKSRRGCDRHPRCRDRMGLLAWQSTYNAFSHSRSHVRPFLTTPR